MTRAVRLVCQCQKRRRREGACASYEFYSQDLAFSFAITALASARSFGVFAAASSLDSLLANSLTLSTAGISFSAHAFTCKEHQSFERFVACAGHAVTALGEAQPAMPIAP